MQIEYPAFLLLFPIMLSLTFVRRKIKLGTIILSNVQFARQANGQMGYKQGNWLFILRMCSLASVNFALCGISICGIELSPFWIKFATFTTAGEIVLGNTALRTLP
ncbi:MAG: hypothetical protein LBD33_01915 [Puniceicoccales bacterium]|jgi:hypothetical protein|nr:hypothetical protein [Puniceicoccales bacterium]